MEATQTLSEAVAGRLRQFFTEKQYTTYRASQELGYGKSTKLNKIMSGETGPSLQTLSELTQTFPELSIDWLVTGEGTMLRQSEAPVTAASEEAPRSVTLVIEQQGKDNIIHVPIRAQAGYALAYDKKAYEHDLTPYSLPILQNGLFRSFDVEGDSMEPTFSNHDIVVCKQIPKPEMMRPGHCYVVVMDDNVLVKRILKQIRPNDRTLLLHSDNQAYAPFEMATSDIKELWLVRARLSTDIPSSEQELQGRLLTVLEALGADYQALRRYVEENAPLNAPL